MIHHALPGLWPQCTGLPLRQRRAPERIRSSASSPGALIFRLAFSCPSTSRKRLFLLAFSFTRPTDHLLASCVLVRPIALRATIVAAPPATAAIVAAMVHQGQRVGSPSAASSISSCSKERLRRVAVAVAPIRRVGWPPSRSLAFPSSPSYSSASSSTACPCHEVVDRRCPSAHLVHQRLVRVHSLRFARPAAEAAEAHSSTSSLKATELSRGS